MVKEVGVPVVGFAGGVVFGGVGVIGGDAAGEPSCAGDNLFEVLLSEGTIF